jgi:hypothetical protein
LAGCAGLREAAPNQELEDPAMTFFDERDLGSVGREARAWLLRDREVARRGREVTRVGREARDWLTHDQRGRVVGLLLFSVAISIAMSLLATAIVDVISRRRAAVSDDATAVEGAEGEPLAAVESPAGVPVMAVTQPASGEPQVEARTEA